MAKQEIVHLVDDLDGGTADTTVTFGLDGTAYEIDLTDEHAAALRDHLSPYVTAARRAGTAATARTRRASGPDGDARRSRPDAQAMRTWARDNGYELSDRGRIPAAVVRAYREAAPAPQAATVPSAPPEATDDDVLAWHEAKGYKIPADRAVNGLMRHRYRAAH